MGAIKALKELISERDGVVIPAGFVVPAAFSAGAIVAFSIPGTGYSIAGAALLLVQAVWLLRFLRVRAAAAAEQEARHDRRRQLLSTLAHELRTPLTVISSSVSILMDEKRNGTLDERQRRFLGSIYSNAHRLETLTENVLAGLKIESWSDSLRLRPVDLRKEVISVVRSLEPTLAVRGQRIHYMFPSMLSRAQADPEWIAQVLINLIHNAGKHTEASGVIDIRVTENEHFIVLSVSDNGSGIPQRRRPDLLEDFVQGDPESEASTEGSGLGLAIVRRIVALHGGELYVAGRPDGGTTVSVTLKKAASRG
ncbi:MAG: sensor histidine kinase [Alkalispirochaeta sp.]